MNDDPVMTGRDFDPYLVNGQLFVTPRQYQELLRVSRSVEAKSDRPLSSLLGDIPVHAVAPGKPIDVGDGRMAALDGDRVVFFPKDAWPKSVRP